MITFRAGRVALITLLGIACAACSREQQDWRSAESADTTEAYGRFLEQHTDSELATQARERIAQLAEQRDWQHAGALGTMDAYREFLAHHPSGHWSEEARIRIEAFALGSAPRIAPQTAAEAAVAPTGVRALQLATGVVAAPPSAAGVIQPAAAAAPAAAGELAQPGEAAMPADGRLAAAPPEPPPVEGAGVPDGSYGVQLGAFGSPASAGREWQRLHERFGAELGGLSPRIVQASTGSGQLYRLQVAAAGEAQARALCDSLKEQSQSCVPVLPR
ncbi:MAG TPA: SPOR domain-containing protein [Steroidobacteraceae bacterium]|nr:SPOR domain-containing protein [Steroidobacteraceae bacterium]